MASSLAGNITCVATPEVLPLTTILVFLSTFSAPPMLVEPSKQPIPHLVPSLQHRSSSSEPGDANANEREKSRNSPRFFQKTVKGLRRRFKLRLFLSRLIGWPAVVICGQLALHIAAWGFFTAVRKWGIIPLPYVTAVGFKAHEYLFRGVFFLMVFVLASCSTFLFSWGVLESIDHLYGKGMPLEPLFSSIELPKRLWGTIWQIIVFVHSYRQGSSWGQLLTPFIFTVATPLAAYELDLSSPLLLQMQGSGVLNYCAVNSTNLPAFYIGQMESGYAAAKSSMGPSTSFRLMEQTFNVSTAGILPLTLEDVDANSWFPSDRNVTIPSTVTSLNKIWDSAPASKYTMKQQGFTADVSCAFRNFIADTSSIIPADPDKDWTFGLPSEIMTHLQMFPDNCVIPDRSRLNFTNAHTAGRPNYVLMIACGRFSENYTLIFVTDGSNNFMESAVCTLSPKITTVQVDYTNASINITQLENGVTDVGGLAGLAAVTTISNMQLFAQAIFKNIVGYELQQAILDVDSGFHNERILFMMEQYLRGVTEYSGSVLRACFSLKNGTFIDGVPLSMTIPSKGYLYIEIVGWLDGYCGTFWGLVPGTIVAIITILVVLMAVARHAGDAVGELFEPAMHRMPTFAPGDLDHSCEVAEPGGTDIRVGEKAKEYDNTDHTTSVLHHRRTRSAGVIEGEL
ncbi:hypothetical protein MVEN_01430000 [Mycena venus]|uniref:Uncharacterized protein n=1 Tax=Mycena venus TaxID=2733690 RepID=A0A8H6XVP8_9AGAR|nr:hypothetical protein MVEN_01430000 [Mycena venus]